MHLFTADGTRFEIDDEDAHLFEGMTFSFKGKYVSAWDGFDSKYVHKILMPDGECDHIDRNKLNCCRDNLRYVTRSENMQNRAAWGCWPKGISFDEQKQLFRARIQKDGKRIGLGRYKVLEEAVAAYNKAAIELYGELAAMSGDTYEQDCA
jgi:hypothetical protein